MKNDLPADYQGKVVKMKEIVRNSNLSTANMRQIELRLRDNGADYFKVEIDDGQVDVKHYG